MEENGKPKERIEGNLHVRVPRNNGIGPIEPCVEIYDYNGQPMIRIAEPGTQRDPGGRNPSKFIECCLDDGMNLAHQIRSAVSEYEHKHYPVSGE